MAKTLSVRLITGSNVRGSWPEVWGEIPPPHARPDPPLTALGNARGLADVSGRRANFFGRKTCDRPSVVFECHGAFGSHILLFLEAAVGSAGCIRPGGWGGGCVAPTYVWVQPELTDYCVREGYKTNRAVRAVVLCINQDSFGSLIIPISHDNSWWYLVEIN